MEVRIVLFPETRMAALEHRGAPAQEHATVRRLVAWKLARGLGDPARHRSYGLHYTDPRTTPPQAYRADFCLSVDEDVPPNPDGIRTLVVPAMRCAFARDVGSRSDNQAARHLVDVWLPYSGEVPADAPLIFHYVNVGPQVRPADMVTDVYLPLR